ncbi:uncharacterized protein LOC111460398 [Cucurbita moschata]|uniref:Uncharacterized protein LOC111460398 n=1 Tax=Cucurbita moschata TaxID=3662 RepID=A0A6J1H678_CUCMO|nr:uncharacterized protein LOC111460398 [Cucurbita moschata]
MENMSIMGSASPETACIIAIQLCPPYFQTYTCDHLHYSWINIHKIFPLMSDLNRAGFSSLSFSFTAPNLANLVFMGPSRLREADFGLNPSNGSRDIGPYDYSTFVTLESKEFINIITDFEFYRYVLVTLTSSQVKFSYTRFQTIITRESGRCVIGGIEESCFIKYIITVHPMHTFCNLVRQTERVWLFKSDEAAKGVISAPLGLHARFVTYFPDDWKE